MSEISSPQIGTREYYAAKIMPPNIRKQELLKKLEEKVWREVAMQLPEDKRPTETELSDSDFLKDHHEWFKMYVKRDKNSITEKIRTNVLSRQMEQLQGDNKENPVYNFLLDLRDIIPYMDGYLDGSDHDEGTRKMGKEWAGNFVSIWREAFEKRQYLPAEDNSDDSGREENWTAQKQFELLTRMSHLSGKLRVKLIEAICLELPSYYGAEFHWDDMQGIYDNIVSSKK